MHELDETTICIVRVNATGEARTRCILVLLVSPRLEYQSKRIILFPKNLKTLRTMSKRARLFCKTRMRANKTSATETLFGKPLPDFFYIFVVIAKLSSTTAETTMPP